MRRNRSGVRMASDDQHLCVGESAAELIDLLLAVSLGLCRHGASSDNDDIGDGLRNRAVLRGRSQLHDLPSRGGILRLQVERLGPVQAASECSEANCHLPPIIAYRVCLRPDFASDRGLCRLSQLIQVSKPRRGELCYNRVHQAFKGVGSERIDNEKAFGDRYRCVVRTPHPWLG